MAKAKPDENEYEDIPGTFVFNADRSRQGYGINMFCMSLMKDENRKAFKANEPEYLKRFNLTPEQTEAVLKRDYNRMLELGGSFGGGFRVRQIDLHLRLIPFKRGRDHEKDEQDR